MNYFKISISMIEALLAKDHYIITHKSNSTVITNKGNKNINLEVSHDLIKIYLSDPKKYKSYKFFLNAYNKYKDSNTVTAKSKTKYCIEMINSIICIYAIKYLFIELQNKNLLTLNQL